MRLCKPIRSIHWVKWETKRSFDVRLCREYSYQKLSLSKSDNWFSSYSQTCFVWDTVYFQATYILSSNFMSVNFMSSISSQPVSMYNGFYPPLKSWIKIGLQFPLPSALFFPLFSSLPFPILYPFFFHCLPLPPPLLLPFPFPPFPLISPAFYPSWRLHTLSPARRYVAVLYFPPAGPGRA